MDPNKNPDFDSNLPTVLPIKIPTPGTFRVKYKPRMINFDDPAESTNTFKQLLATRILMSLDNGTQF